MNSKLLILLDPQKCRFLSFSEVAKKSQNRHGGRRGKGGGGGKRGGGGVGFGGGGGVGFGGGGGAPNM